MGNFGKASFSPVPMRKWLVVGSSFFIFNFFSLTLNGSWVSIYLIQKWVFRFEILCADIYACVCSMKGYYVAQLSIWTIGNWLFLLFDMVLHFTFIQLHLRQNSWILVLLSGLWQVMYALLPVKVHCPSLHCFCSKRGLVFVGHVMLCYVTISWSFSKALVLVLWKGLFTQYQKTGLSSNSMSIAAL